MAEPDVTAPAPAAPAAPWPSLRDEELGAIEKRHLSELRHYRWRWVWPPSFRGAADWQRLRQSVAADGLRDPLIILADGQVIDGGHRLDLAKECGPTILPVRVATLPLPLSDADRLRVETFAVLQAAARRQLRPEQTIAMLLSLARGRAELARRQASLANLRRDLQPGRGPWPGSTVAALAAEASVSERQAKRAIRVVRHGSPELQARVRAGEISLKQADWSLREPPKPAPPPADATRTALRELCAAFLARVEDELVAAASWPPDGRRALTYALGTLEQELRQTIELIEQQREAP